MHTTIVGCGAIGSVAAVGFHKAGWPLTLVDSAEEHVQAIHTQGLEIEDNGQIHRLHVPAVLPSNLHGPIDLAVLAVKSQHTEQALEQLTPHLASHSVVLSLQNGLNPSLIANSVGQERTIGAFVNFQAVRIGPGRVKCGRRGSIYIGEVSGDETDRVATIQAALEHIRPTYLTRNIFGYLWAKMAYASMLTASALVDAPVYEFIERYPELIQAAVGEIADAADAQGIHLERFDFVDPAAMSNRSYDFTEMLEDWRAREIPYTGIWRDIVVHKRPTEVGTQMGYIIKEAEQAGQAMPINQRLIQMIEEIERGQRTQGWSNLEELAAFVPQEGE